MKQFIYKTSCFILIPILFFGVNMVINYLIYNNQRIPINNTSILIAGDSHPQKSINPQYFRDAQNISQTAEPYVLTFWKLKKLFTSYVPDTLIIGFAPHNISRFNDLKFSDERWSWEMFKRSYPIQEYRTIANKISVDYLTFYKVLWKQTGWYPKKDHINFLGNYSNSDATYIDDAEDVIKRHYYQNGIEWGVSELAVTFLDSIVTLASSKKINLIMVSNPVHEKYLNHIPVPIMEKFDELMDKYKGCCIVFDKTRDHYPDSLFLNSDHLNEMGAKQFTEELKDYIKTQTPTHNRVYKK